MRPDPDESLARQIAVTAKRTRQWADDIFAEHGSSLVTWIVLRHALQAEPPGFSQSQLAADMSIGSPALVRHLDRLESEGLVVRQRDPDDRRVTRVAITTKGRRRHAQLADVAAEIDRHLRSLLSDREARTLFNALARIEDHLVSADRTQSA